MPSQAVFRRAGDVITVSLQDLAPLIPAAAAASSRRARLCLHAGDEDLTQEMVICLLRDCYVRPHRHADKSESFLILEGRLTVILFDDSGDITQVIPLQSGGNHGSYYYRLSAAVWHTVVVEGDHVLFHETTTGPFIPSQTEFAPWAPAEGSSDAVGYAARLRSLAIANTRV